MITFSKKINELDFSNVSAQLDKFSKSINEIATMAITLKKRQIEVQLLLRMLRTNLKI